ncbi:hypothetical protein, partial [Thalassobacillus devorans]|uniref:hypothetical protein n=1 Tax=Thalassobacillus devorans TaxID=279813 RepID=UPI001F2D51AE
MVRETTRFPAASPRHSRHKQSINGKKEHFPFAVLLMRVVSPKAITHLFLSCGGPGKLPRAKAL